MMSRFKTQCDGEVPSLSLQQNAASVCFQCRFPCSSCIRHDKNSSRSTGRSTQLLIVAELTLAVFLDGETHRLRPVRSGAASHSHPDGPGRTIIILNTRPDYSLQLGGHPCSHASCFRFRSVMPSEHG